MIWPLVPYSKWTWTTPALPSFYWNVYSAEQRWKQICCELAQLKAYIDSENGIIEAINLNRADIEKLLAEFEEFKNHGFDDYYANQVAEWISNNLDFIFTQVAKQVFFGLTLDGYFCAWVPTSWEDIVFDTGAVYGRFDYGRLILRWCADNTHIVMQPNSGIFEEQFADSFQKNLDRLNRTCYTVINEGDELV